jgi:hypothetical protein
MAYDETTLRVWEVSRCVVTMVYSASRFMAYDETTLRVWEVSRHAMMALLG